MKTLKIITLALVSITVLSCGDSSTDPADVFNRSLMLKQVAEGTIIPSYAEAKSRAEALEESVLNFTQAPSRESLVRCREDWLLLAEQWQRVVIFDFGPAEGLLGNLSLNVGTFPASDQKIEELVLAGDTTLTNFDRDTRGLFGVEYLLYHGELEDVLSEFSVDQGSNRSAYLRSIVRRIVTEVGDVCDEWVSSYAADFQSRTGTSVGSGTSLLFNNLSIGYELFKNYKIALPLGKMAGQSSPEPTKVEAYYSGQSIRLLRIHYQSVMDLWSGKSVNGTKILGFRDYLESVPSGNRLISETEEQHSSVQVLLNQFSDQERLSQIITTSPSRIEPLQVESQKLTRFLKSELSSLIGISITYSSGDGD